MEPNDSTMLMDPEVAAGGGDGEDSSFDLPPPPPAPEPEEDAEEEPAAPEADEPAADDDEDDDEDLRGKLPQKEYRRVKRYREQRRQAREELSRANTEKQALEARLAELEAEKADRDDPEPDPLDDADGYKAWALRSAERKLRIGTPKAPSVPQTPAAPAAPSAVDIQRDEVRSRHADYDRYVSRAVINRIETDPALYDRVWQSKNPPLEAYRVGKELVDGAAPKPATSGAGSGFRGKTAPISPSTLTPEQRRVARMAGMTEDEYAKEYARVSGARRA